MSANTYAIGPANASLRIHTGREGRAARAGHDLEIEVGDWTASLELGDTPEVTQLSLSANARSLRVLAGTGGMQSLDEDGKANIATTIDAEVLNGGEISFRSTDVHGGDGAHDLHVHGELTLLGRTAPIAFTLAVAQDGSFSAEAVIKQTDFGMKPYSALFGTLKVKDEVRVSAAGRLAAT